VCEIGQVMWRPDIFGSDSFIEGIIIIIVIIITIIIIGGAALSP
jgi:hypothetical protein